MTVQAVNLHDLALIIGAFFTSKAFLVNCVLTIILTEIALRRMESLQPKTKEDHERDIKFRAFRMQRISPFVRIPFFLLAPFTLIKWLIGWGAALVNGTFLTLMEMIRNPREPHSSFEKLLVNWSTYLTAKTVMWSSNCFFVDTIRPKVDYSSYLGKDWVPSYDRPGSVVSNHCCWMDIIVHMSRQPPSHVAKTATKKIPGVGMVA